MPTLIIKNEMIPYRNFNIDSFLHERGFDLHRPIHREEDIQHDCIVFSQNNINEMFKGRHGRFSREEATKIVNMLNGEGESYMERIFPQKINPWEYSNSVERNETIKWTNKKDDFIKKEEFCV